MKVRHHHIRFLCNGIRVAFHKRAALLLCSLLIKHQGILHRFYQPVVTGIRQQLADLHHGIDFILVVHLIVGGKAGRGQVHLGRVSVALPGMRLVDNDANRFSLLVAPMMRLPSRMVSRRSPSALPTPQCLTPA